MPEELENPSQLGRREFVRRAVMTAAATAAATPLLGADRLVRLASAQGGIPSLRAPGRVTGLAARDSGLAAVGMDGGTPFVWTHSFGAPNWVPSAGLSAFPAGIGLSSVTAVGDVLYAAGVITQHLHTGMLHVHDEVLPEPRPIAPGTIVAEAAHPPGHEIELEEHLFTPVILASADGKRWDVVLQGVAGIAGGAFNGIATLEGSRLLVVGAEFPELDVSEASGMLAFISNDGRTWSRISLDGVVPPQHGDVTLLAEVGDKVMLGTVGHGTIALYVASRSGPWLSAGSMIPDELGLGVRLPAVLGDWRRIEHPEVEGGVSFVAAGPLDGSVFLAGIDTLDDARFWTLRGGTWHELGPPAGLTGRSRLYDLEPVDGTLVAGGADGDQTLVTKVRG